MELYRLVYSTDPKRNPVCSQKKKPACEDRCRRDDLPAMSEPIIAFLRIEKKNRRGKTVTLVDRLPRSEIFLRTLAKEIKTKCGAGGTFYTGLSGGVIEVQGDCRDKIRKILSEKGMKFKG